MDAKCARLYKPKWFNEKITLPNRDMFTFTKRDDCMAFLLVLEFFERECREQSVTAEDCDNLRFRFGDLLEYAAMRFRSLMEAKEDGETVRFYGTYNEKTGKVSDVGIFAPSDGTFIFLVGSFNLDDISKAMAK